MLNRFEFHKAAQDAFVKGANYGRYAAHVLGAAIDPRNPMNKQAQDAVADAQNIANQMDAADAGVSAGMGAAGDAGGSAAEQIQCPQCGSVVVPNVDGTCPVCGFNILEALMASAGQQGGGAPAPEMSPEEMAATEQVVQAALTDPNVMQQLLSYNWVR